jgi:hypothetical protein
MSFVFGHIKEIAILICIIMGVVTWTYFLIRSTKGKFSVTCDSKENANATFSLEFGDTKRNKASHSSKKTKK